MVLLILGDAGLTHPLGGLWATISEYEKSSDMTEASVNMSAATDDEEDSVAYSPDSVPVPITSKGFRLDIRRLEASRRLGEGLDTTQAEMLSTLGR